jgi:hypothetical protein
LQALVAAAAIGAQVSTASAEVNVQKTTWRGHAALQLSNGTVELLLVTGVGPRIVRYGFVGGENILGELPPDAAPTKTALGEWYLYGGHRIWAAPEAMPATYAPDNGPVDVKVDGATVTLTQPVDAAGFQKIMTVTLASTGTSVKVGNRVVNASRKAVEIAPWALTVLNGGGVVIIPNEPYKSHDEELSPARAITAWTYTNFSDPRWTLGPKYTRLRVDPSLKESQKVGVSNRRGWAGYFRQGQLFVKQYDWLEGRSYPDFGVNTETYTSANFVELETLGPLATLKPGESAAHEERWTLYKGVDIGTTEESLDAAIQATLFTAKTPAGGPAPR